MPLPRKGGAYQRANLHPGLLISIIQDHRPNSLNPSSPLQQNIPSRCNRVIILCRETVLERRKFVFSIDFKESEFREGDKVEYVKDELFEFNPVRGRRDNLFSS